MSEPKEITAALDSIARASTPARELAKEAVRRHREWKSNAEKEGLPLVNTTTNSGAPLLDRDAVLRKSYPNHAGKKA